MNIRKYILSILMVVGLLMTAPSSYAQVADSATVATDGIAVPIDTAVLPMATGYD